MGVLRLYGMLLLAACIVIVAGCSGGEKTLPAPTGLTAVRAGELDGVSQRITTAVAAGFDPTHPAQSLATLATSVGAFAGVNTATANDDALVVTYTDGYQEQWLAPQPYARPSWLATRGRPSPATRVTGAPTALIIDTLTLDSAFTPDVNTVRAAQQDLAQMLTASGFAVTTAEGEQATLSTFAGFANYRLVILLTQGNVDGSLATNRAWLTTGENANTTQALLDHATAWQAGTLRRTHCAGIHGSYWALSDRWLAAHYAAQSLPGTLILNGACHGYEQGSNSSLADALLTGGAATYVGFTGRQSLAPWSIQALVGYLLTGMNIDTATNTMLVTYGRQSQDSGTITTLRYLPATSGNVQLTTATPPAWGVTLTSPVQNETVSSPLYTIHGAFSGLPAHTAATVTVNGSPAPLTVNYDGTFVQQVLLTQLDNTIEVSGISALGTAHTAVTVHQIFAGLTTFWSELIWDTNNTDVDLHLLPPQTTLSSLWTPRDCCYEYPAPTWGALLESDVATGFGPERITMAAPAPGDYTLVAHYFADNGQGSTRAQAFLSVRNGPIQLLGPHTLTHSGARSGDLWVICTINYPSGAITPVDQIVTLPANGSGGGKGRK